MWPNYFCAGGMWIFPFVGLLVMLLMIYLVFGRRSFHPPCDTTGHHESNRRAPNSDTPLEILKRRYAKGEIGKEEFDRVKRDLLD